MKAAILTELNKDLVIRDDVGLTDLGAGEVHIKVVSSGVCHSDVSAQNGTIPSGTPCVLGHEGAGIVLDSVPAHELRETQSKAASLGRAIDLAESAFSTR